VTQTGERALYALTYWLRRRDTQAVADLAAALDDDVRAEARELYLIDGVPRALYEMPEPELRARMTALAGLPAKAASG
jgi:hypothetical protein